jgi:hypothetical protein
MLSGSVPCADSVLLLDAPIEAAMLLDPDAPGPRVFHAVSFGLTSLSDSIACFEQKEIEVAKEADGGYRVDLGGGLVCNARAALGMAPARLVCSDREPALKKLAPYLAAGLPTAQLGAGDVFAKVEAAPFRERYGDKAKMVRIGVPLMLRELDVDSAKLEGAVSDAGYADLYQAISYN